MKKDKNKFMELMELREEQKQLIKIIKDQIKILIEKNIESNLIGIGDLSYTDQIKARLDLIDYIKSMR